MDCWMNGLLNLDERLLLFGAITCFVAYALLLASINPRIQ